VRRRRRLHREERRAGQGDGAALAGDVRVIDIGLPVGAHGIDRVEDADVGAWLPPRAPGGNKWAAAVLVAAGSPGMTGAAAMCAAAAYRAGLELKANIVFIPTFVDLDQVEAVAVWVASIDRTIPFHIMGYIPVPGQPFPRPTVAEMDQALAACRRHLDKVDASHLTVEEALNLAPRDDRFTVRQIA